MPAMESIARCKRKLAKTDEIFRADSKKVIEARLKQSKEILEAVCANCDGKEDKWN